MYQISIPEGALFFISSHRRLPVPLTEGLRARTRETAFSLRQLRESLSVPQAEYGPKCKRCSLLEYCMPRVKNTAETYCRELENEAREAADGEGRP